jgi:polyferredoxin
MSTAHPDGFDLVRLRAVRALLLWRGFPYVPQAVILTVFIAMIALSWGRFPPDGISAKLFGKSHLTTLLIWGIWWPSIIWMTVLFGRVWCMVCPLELVSNLAERLGRLIGIRQSAPRRWMISGAIAVALYGLIQLLVAAVHIHRIPAYTAWFLVGLLAFPAIVGIFFKDRTFCRVLCPVGQLLATYGRGGMLAVRAASAEACAACIGKDCLRACNRTKWDGRSCPSLLNPPKLNSDRDCLVCGQCIKSCQPDNMRLLLRRPFHEKDTREPVASWPTTAFVMLVSGFVTWELCAEWPAAALHQK